MDNHSWTLIKGRTLLPTCAKRLYILQREKLTRREFFRISALATLAMTPMGKDIAKGLALDLDTKDYPVGQLQPVPIIRQRQEWTRFIILVWQYQNDVRRDSELYGRAGLHGFHIDRGAREDEKVRLSLERQFPYYVDHAAGKGILYLARDVQAKISRKSSLQVRPYSLADPKTIEALKESLRKNVDTTKKGLVYAYAFDDEISTGAFNNPVEIDIHPLSIAWYRRWLAQRYSTIERLNTAWGSAYTNFNTIEPKGFEEVRRQNDRAPFSSWNLSQWMEWRHFTDYQFAQILAELTRYTNKLDRRIPAGFVGGQQPSAYGGYDYALLSRAVQWMEASDLGDTNEILRSFWNRPRRVRVQTYHARAEHKKNTWVLWHRLAHGQQAAIAWPAGWMRENPSGTRELSPVIERLAPTFREVQGAAGEFILDPKSYLETDPIGIYYSHPSIRVGWAMDSVVHGATWPSRLTGIDDDNLSSAWLRLSWCKLLEDLGYQYEFISYLDVHEGYSEIVNRFKIIILPQTICLSDREAHILHRFVHSGGVLVSDTLCGLLTETGRGRRSGVLDKLFGLRRDESLGYLDGRGITEVDANNFKKPLPERLQAYNASLRYRSMIVFERGTRSTRTVGSRESVKTSDVLIRNKTGKGSTLYLNLTPLAYAYSSFRTAVVGREWRELMRNELRAVGLEPRVEVFGADGVEPWMECLLWRNGNRYCLAILKNTSGPGGATGSLIAGPAKEITIRLNLPVKGVRNIRTGKIFGTVTSFKDTFYPSQANLYRFDLEK